MKPDFKEIIDLLKKGATVPAQEKIMELREIHLELREENLSLKQKVKELEEQQKIKGQREWDDSLCIYWLKNDEEKRWPYCPVCWDKDDKPIRLQKWTNDSWHCFVCNSTYGWEEGPTEIHETFNDNW